MNYFLINCPSRSFWKQIAAIIVAASFPVLNLMGAIPMTGSSFTYVENFNSLPNSASTSTSAPWVNDSLLPGWYANKTNNSITSPLSITARDGSTNTGLLYSFGSIGSTDRSLGSIASGTPGNLAYGIQLQNVSSSEATIRYLAYYGEQWRCGGNLNQQRLSLWYKISSTLITDLSPGDTLNTGWIAIPSGDFLSLVNVITGKSLNGNDTSNRSLIAINPGLTLAPGEFLMFRWLDINDSGNDHGFAIDDFVISTEVTNLPLSPSLSSVSPNPVPPSNSRQEFTLNGANFDPNCTVTLRDLRTGEIFPNRPKVSSSSTSIVLNPIFGTIAGDWNVEVINPGGLSSGTLSFKVSPPDAIVTNVRSAQRPGTTLVDLYYDLSGPISSTVTVELSVDSGTTYTLSAPSLSGDLGTSVASGNNRHIVWNAGTDKPNFTSSNMRFRITAVANP